MAGLMVKLNLAVVLKEIYEKIPANWDPETQPLHEIVSNTVQSHVDNIQEMHRHQGHELSETVDVASNRVTEEVVNLISVTLHKSGMGTGWDFKKPLTQITPKDRLHFFDKAPFANSKGARDLILATIDNMGLSKQATKPVPSRPAAPAPVAPVTRLEPTAPAESASEGNIPKFLVSSTGNAA